MKPSLIPSSLTSRLILLGIALLLIGALGRTVLLSNYLRDDLQKQTADQLLAIANYVAQDIERDLADRQRLLERVAGNLGRVTNPADWQARLGQAQNLNPLFSHGMLLVDRAGRVRLDYPPHPGRSGSSLAERAYFQTALAGKSSIGRPFIDDPATGAILPMAVPVRDANDAVTAVLVGYSALHSANFMAALYATRIGDSGGLLLVSPEHRLFVAASDQGRVLRPTPADGVNPMHDRTMRGFRGTGITVNAAGTEEIAATASVPSGNWFVVARQPTEEAFAPLDRLRSFILKNTAVILPAFIVFMVIVMRSMLRPLMETARRADLMTLGEIPLATLPVARNDEVGHLTGAFNRMLSKLLESRAELAHMAHHDPLTGLPNRKLLADRMSQALARAQRNQTRIAILFLDLDGFKPINDRFGHEAGDQALVEVARRLGGMLRQEDTLARVGGDEFVILISDLTDNAERVVAKVAEKCLAIFAPEFAIAGHDCRLSTSIGIAVGDADGEQLLIAADQAMYRAKEQGRGRYCWT
ncbi:diguanylate cyclase domain-containing protein [Azonexus sp.]|uniref:sensor domain-containing diguanylate cyclase n=1 Tax=Azonexus sp. TaxID=1872668 RepID=UPI0035B0C7AC